MSLFIRARRTPFLFPGRPTRLSPPSLSRCWSGPRALATRPQSFGTPPDCRGQAPRPNGAAWRPRCRTPAFFPLRPLHRAAIKGTGHRRSPFSPCPPHPRPSAALSPPPLPPSMPLVHAGDRAAAVLIAFLTAAVAVPPLPPR
jgi:hypothetical protein